MYHGKSWLYIRLSSLFLPLPMTWLFKPQIPSLQHYKTVKNCAHLSIPTSGLLPGHNPDFFSEPRIFKRVAQCQCFVYVFFLQFSPFHNLPPPSSGCFSSLKQFLFFPPQILNLKLALEMLTCHHTRYLFREELFVSPSKMHQLLFVA